MIDAVGQEKLGVVPKIGAATCGRRGYDSSEPRIIALSMTTSGCV